MYDSGKHNKIKLYLGNISMLEAPEAFEECLRLVDEARRSKIRQLRGAQVQKRSLLAGYLLQIGLKESGYSKSEIPFPLAFEFTKQGKPILCPNHGLHFNLSHSGDYVMCGIAGEEIGVDIQQHGSVRDATVKRFFSDEDTRLLQEAPEGEKEKCFFDLWSVKEAYVKLTGLGLAQGMGSLWVDFINGLAGTAEESAAFVMIPQMEGYSMAVCCRTPGEMAVKWINRMECTLKG